MKTKQKRTKKYGNTFVSFIKLFDESANGKIKKNTRPKESNTRTKNGT